MILLAWLHLAATLAMTGLIWFVQVVHYPLFRYARGATFADFAAAHQARTTWVVLPLMTLELVSAVALAAVPPPGGRAPALVGLALVIVIWLSTAFLQVPDHRRLSRGFDPGAAARLVRTNWIRTCAWTARSILALTLLAP